MKELHREGLSPEEHKATELAWLKENVAAFWSTAYAGYCEGGRGAVVIDTTTEGMGEDTPFQYSLQALIEAQEDSTSQQLAELVAGFDPESQFVAVFIRPGVEELEFSMFQIGVGETLLQAMEARGGQSHLPEASGVTPAEAPKLEPPDLDTLMA